MRQVAGVLVVLCVVFCVSASAELVFTGGSVRGVPQCASNADATRVAGEIKKAVRKAEDGGLAFKSVEVETREGLGPFKASVDYRLEFGKATARQVETLVDGLKAATKGCKFGEVRVGLGGVY